MSANTYPIIELKNDGVTKKYQPIEVSDSHPACKECAGENNINICHALPDCYGFAGLFIFKEVQP